MKKFILGVALMFSTQLMAENLGLQAGWNLIGIDQNISLETIKSEVGVGNLEVIQGVKKTYKKKYIDEGLSQLNDFTGFEKGKGYWVRIKSSATITYVAKQYSGEEITPLKKGWNIINPLLNLTLKEILAQLGKENVLIIQGANKTYQKQYVDEGNSGLNDFTAFETGKGYWIKLSAPSEIKYSFELSKEVIDNTGHPVKYNITLDNKIYSVVVYSNNSPKETISNSTISIYGLINGIDTASNLKLNDSYSSDTTFQVKVFDQNNQLVGTSSVIDYNSEVINFSSILIDTGSSTDGGTGDNTDTTTTDTNNTVSTLKTIATPLTKNDFTLAQITDSDFNALSFKNQIIVADKLFSSLYFGMPYLELKSLILSGKFISTIRENLDKNLNDVESIESYIVNKNYFHLPIHNETNEVPLVNSNAIVQHRLFAYEYLDKNFFEHWMTYVLMQTIMFSPASELSSATLDSVMPVYNAIYENIKKDSSIRYLTYKHMSSLYNWRRFRSSEDNGREMIEIFLFDREDSHVPPSAKALQNWKLNDKRELIISADENKEPIEMFGKTIYNGYDFYEALVLTDKFMDSVTQRLVNIYFNTFSAIQKKSVISAILESHPENFKDIFLQILFSKEHLYNTNRVKTVDEIFYSMAKKIHFGHDAYTFQSLNRVRVGMHQSAMTYKLGASVSVPIDASSFGIYREFIYKEMMIKIKPNKDNYDWGKNGWIVDELLTEALYESVPSDDLENRSKKFLNYLFLSTVSREVTPSEWILFYGRIQDEKNWFGAGGDGSTQIVFDYISRLTELFQYQKVK